MSTGNLALDILLDKLKEDAISGRRDAMSSLKERFPALSEDENCDLHSMFMSMMTTGEDEKIELVATTPPSFGIKAKSTMNTVIDMLQHANSSILITGYSLSEYFSNMIDTIINKSKRGVLVKFYVNQIENQNHFTKLCSDKGRFLKIYNYTSSEDKMAALHAKVICVDGEKTLITSANLSYHGQAGNIELGSVIKSRRIAKQIDDVFTQLLFRGVFTEV